jgi:hypothetical protein
MSELSKQALKVENNQSFPNNTDGLITPTALRGFNEDMIDSLVDEITYNTDSASWDNSIDLLNQFTSSQQPSFTALNAFTQSQLAINSGYNNATQSLQGQITTLVSEVDSLQTFTSSVNEISDNGVVQGISTRLHFYGNVSASIVQNVNGPIASIEIPFSGVDTGSLLTTASFAAQTLTFTKGDGSTFGVVIPDVSGSTINTGSFATTGSNVFIGNQTITGSLLISGSEVVTGPLTASRLQINGITDLNGTLDVSNDATFRGNVIIQSSGEQKLLMRSTSGGGVSQGFDLLIQTSSFIIRDETHDIDFLEFDYISSSADHILKLEANRFEMNSGSLGISGSLTASLQEGYAWVGDSSGRTQAIPTSSFGGGGTGNGFPFSGSAVITGSLSVSETIKSQVYMNPQTLDGFTIPTNNNAMLVGPVAISGSVVVEGNSNLLILSQITSSGATPLPSGVVSGSSQLTSSYDLRYALSGSGGGTIPTGSFATTGSNTFIGTQTITGSLFLSSSNNVDFIVPSYLGQPAPGGLSVTGSMSVRGNFSIIDGNCVINQVNTGKIVGLGSTLSLVSNIKIFNDSDINDARSLGVSGSAFVSQSISIGEAVKIAPSDPLPSGTIGSLAVSGSSLYFYNGAWTLVV